MKRWLLLSLLFFAPGCGERVGPLNTADTQLALRFSARDFDAEQWREKNLSVRGNMLASLMQSHASSLKRGSGVSSLLGPSECYVAYDGEPCYEVLLGDQLFELQFGLNHSSHPDRVEIVRLKAIPQVSNAILPAN